MNEDAQKKNDNAPLICPRSTAQSRVAPALTSDRCPPTPDPEGFIKCAEVARRLKKSIRTIQYWQRAGIIPYIKCGRTTLFNWSEIVNHLHANFLVCHHQPSTPNRKETQ